MRALCAVIVCAFAAVACEGSKFPSAPTPVHPAGLVSVIAPAAVSASSFACNGAATLPSNINLAITAARSTVFLDSVTLHLVDGTNLSASAVSFPRAGLDAQFGSTRIVFGSNRTFGLRPLFSCGAIRPYALRADLILLDELGLAHPVSTMTSIR